MSKISVIMAVYNEEKFLDESISSILDQTLNNFEFIIIDDKSTDNSLAIIEKYREEDDRIQIITNKKNIGRALSRNKGLKIARGKYIAVQDADDISLPSRLKVEYNFLEKHKGIFLVGSDGIYIDENGKSLSNHTCLYYNNLAVRRQLPEGNFMLHSSIMFRNKENILYRSKLVPSEDTDFLLLTLSQGYNLSNINKPLVKYRYDVSTLSYDNLNKHHFLSNKAKEFYRQRIGTNKDDYQSFDPTEIQNIGKLTFLKKKLFLLLRIRFPLIYKIYMRVKK